MKNANGEEVYMEELVPAIMSADATDLEDLIYWIRLRHGQLYPQWELQLLSIQKQEDCGQQLDRVIAMLERLKGE